MQNVLTRKLERYAPLSADERLLLDKVVEPSRVVNARTDLVTEGRASGSVRLILDGLACRYKTLKNGKRQIVAYLIPGDFCDLNAVILREMDHSIATISVCSVVDIPRNTILELTGRAKIARAFWWVTLVDEGTLREWLLNIGQRRSTERIAHLFCELFARFEVVGLTKGGSYNLPLIQSDIADTTGLSFVHVNRCLQQLRDMELITFKRKTIAISNLSRLMEFCDFNPNYLHLDGGRGDH